MDHGAFDDMMTAVNSALVVVTTAAGGERAGCLVGFHTQSSIDPPRFGIWLSKANHTYRVALRCTHLGIHFLGSGDLGLAELFGTLTGDETDKFAGLATESGENDVPLLTDVANRIVGRRTALLDEGGDHVCVVTEVVDAYSAGPLTPLRLSDAAHLAPGHGSEERSFPPTQRASDDAER